MDLLNPKMPAPVQSALTFTDRNHWRFGWGDGLYNFHEQNKPAWAAFGPCLYNPKSFDVEIAAAARRIADSTTKPLYVAMSGGMDSELVARIMLQERIPFKPLLAHFNEDYNKDDLSYAYAFCKQHNLAPEIMKIDIIPFLKDSFDTPYILGNCAHLLQMQLMRHAASLGGLAVVGVGEHRYEDVGGKIFFPVITEGFAVAHFMQAENIQAIPAFYRYTPETMLSLLREAKAHGFQGMSDYAHNIKEYIYRKYWPDMAPRPKYSGFEGVSEHRRNAQVRLQVKYGKLLGKILIPLEELEAQLSKGLNTLTGG